MSFFRRNKEKIIVISITIILIIIIGYTNQDRIKVSLIENKVGNMMLPISKNINKLGNRFFGTIKNFRDIFSLREDNQELQEKVLKLESENKKYKMVLSQSDYLLKHYELLGNTNYNLMETSVIGKNPGNWYYRFTIDKGSKDGVKEGDILVQAVETDEGTIIEGLVGRVSSVGEDWAKIITVVDELNSVAFKVLRTQDGGMLSGSAEGDIKGFLFDDESNIIKGDKLYTSGLGGKYRKDIYIGEVKEVKNSEEEMIKVIEVEPAVNFKKIYELYILMD